MISVHHGCPFFHDAKSRWVKTHLAEPITPTTACLHHNLFRPGNPSSPFDPAQIDAQEHHAHHVGHPRAVRLMKTSPLPEIQPQRPAPSNPATIRPILQARSSCPSSPSAASSPSAHELVSAHISRRSPTAAWRGGRSAFINPFTMASTTRR
ncbi:hypothetical protein ACLOJK_034370 [Asimina triloba]